MEKKTNEGLKPSRVPYLGTIYVGNPVAKIEVGVFADSPGKALDLVNRFAKYADYPVTDTRVDLHLIIDEEILQEFEKNKKLESDVPLE